MMSWGRIQQQWTSYFQFLEDNMNSKVYKSYLVFQQLSTETPRAFFSGTRVRGATLLQWKKAWFFTGDYAMMTGNTLEERYVLIPIKNRITSLVLNNRPSTIGGLSVEFTLDEGSSHVLEAWGSYCEVLKDIIINYLKPNLKMNAPSPELAQTAISLERGYAPHPMLRR